MRTPDARTPVRAGVTLLGVLALVLALLPATAFAQEAGDDRFTCQATLIRIEDNAVLGTVALGEANTENDGDPCQTDDGSLIGEVALGPVTADVLYSRTSDETDQGAKEGHAESGVANVTLDLSEGGGPVINVRVLTAETQAGPCPSTELSGNSEVVSLRVDGEEQLDVPATFTGEEHFELEIPGVGTLHLNEEDEPDENTIRRRALFFEDQTGVVGNIIIAEAISDVHGDPCGDGPPEDRFAGFFTGGGFVAEPGSNRDHNDEGEVDPGTVAHHAFVLDCFEEEGVDPRPGKDNLVVQWFDEDNNEHASVKLTELEDTRCFSDEAEGDAAPPPSEFNTIEGSGQARCRTKVLGEPMEFPAEIEFRFTDEGEPGRNKDEARIEVTSPHPMAPIFCNFTSDSGEAGIDGGNHQAHQLPSQAGGNGSNGGSNANANRF